MAVMPAADGAGGHEDDLDAALMQAGDLIDDAADLDAVDLAVLAGEEAGTELDDPTFCHGCEGATFAEENAVVQRQNAGLRTPGASGPRPGRPFRGQDAALRGADDVAFLHEERLVDFLERVGVLADGGADAAESDRPAVMLLGQRAEEAVVHVVEALLVDLEELRGRRP
jgi:hypothetical protein